MKIQLFVLAIVLVSERCVKLRRHQMKTKSKKDKRSVLIEMKEVLKPPLDDRKVYSAKLTNNLGVMIIHDPDIS